MDSFIPSVSQSISLSESYQAVVGTRYVITCASLRSSLREGQGYRQGEKELWKLGRPA